MFRHLLVFITLSALTPTHGQNCNICGDGNTIQNTLGVVEFEYEGTVYKNNCERWQVVVQNPNAISDEFCRNEMLQYTKDVCRCTTPSGDLLSDLPSPTTAPTPSSVFVKSPTAAVDDHQNDTPNNETTTVSKCEQTSGNDNNDCNDEAPKDKESTSSASNPLFIHLIGTLMGCIGVYMSQ